MFIYSCVILFNWWYSTYLSQIIVSHPIYAFLFQECIYWIFGIFCWVLDKYQVKTFRVKNPRPDTLTEWDILPTVIRNHMILFIFHYFYSSFFSLEVFTYTFLEFCANLLVFFILSDVFFYIGHRLMHHPKIYSMVHKQHHLTRTTIGISGYYMGVIDFFGEFIIPFYLPFYLMGNCPLLMITAGLIGQLNGILSHSGHDLPLMPWSDDHQIHHLEQNYNFGFFVTDYILRTKK